MERSVQTANIVVQKHAAEVKHVTRTMECVRSVILERLVQIAHTNAVKTVYLVHQVFVTKMEPVSVDAWADGLVHSAINSVQLNTVKNATYYHQAFLVKLVILVTI